MSPIGFGYKTGDLTRHIGPTRQLTNMCRPRFEFTFGYLRFRGVIENKPLVRVPVDEVCRFYQLPFMDEDVTSQVKAREFLDTAIELWPIKISIGLSLNDLP